MDTPQSNGANVEPDYIKRNRDAGSSTFVWSGILVLLVALVAGGIFHKDAAAIREYIKTKQAVLFSSKTPNNYSDAPVCKIANLTGVVHDCGCDFQTVDSVNLNVLHPILKQLVQKPFFKYFKTRLWCECPFWPDDGMCVLRDCSVCECSEDEVPLQLRHSSTPITTPSTSSSVAPSLSPDDSPHCQEGRGISAVDRTLEEEVFHAWTEGDNPWTHDNEADNTDMTFVNLVLNPEKYTGYKGDSARRIWEAIYMQSCFKDGVEEVCPARRVLFRLISGLHSSITLSVASNFLLDKEKGLWGHNLLMFREALAKHPDRLQNLYFTYLFVLRAATKARSFLSTAHYDTGNPQEDEETVALVRRLVDNERLQAACPVPFDEGQLWKGEGGPELKEELQAHFRNISSIMDCVGCEKCRLWGKLQILGLGTALKILFSVDQTVPQPAQKLSLQRNEVSALVNLLARLSQSLETSRKLLDELHIATRDGIELKWPGSN